MSIKKDPSSKKQQGLRGRYWFDNVMSRGMLSLIGFLAVVTSAFIIIFALVVWATRIFPEMNFFEIFWLSIFRTLNSGLMGDGRMGIIYFILALISALVSILITSLLIGLLTSGIDQKIRALQKGRSKVIEKDHTIILGWSEMIFAIISNLAEAGRGRKKNTIVIMGDREKVSMDDEIRERIELPRNLKIVCRQGNPVSVNDLKIVNIPDSKSVIILEDSDSRLVKTLLAINNTIGGMGQSSVAIVAMMKKYRNLNTAQIAGQGRARFVLNKKFIAELIAHTCYQPGLSIVYNDLLSFEGDEINMKNIKELSGITFKDSLFMFEKCSVIGIESAGIVKLNPSMDTIIEATDRIIAICANENELKVDDAQAYVSDENIIEPGVKTGLKEESILILGWNDSGKIIINELDNYIVDGTKISILADSKMVDAIRDKIQQCDEPGIFDISVKNAKLDFLSGDITDYELLENIVLKNNFNHIVVLAYNALALQEADSITLMTLVHLRDIAEKNNLSFSITSEILDVSNRELAKVAKVNDFIVSERLSSLFLSQLSENRQLGPVFDDLLSDYGSEIYLKNIAGYVKTGTAVNYATLVKAASNKNEVAIGYKIAAQEAYENRNFGIYLNPEKSSEIIFDEKDSIIVISEEIL